MSLTDDTAIADAPAAIGELRMKILPVAQAIKAAAARCDAMCLSAGIPLGDAVPGLYELSNRFASLSSVLEGDEGSSAPRRLEVIADDIAKIGDALKSERRTLNALLKLNAVLSRHIEHLAEHVRFLSAAVSSVKIELASINEDALRLESFADTLHQLTTKSQATIDAFQSRHQDLVQQLKRTVKAQSEFETSHGAKLLTASKEITLSLEVVKGRRKAIAATAGEIGKLTQQIGMQIAQSVVAFQVGDSTRQRLEHAGDALSLAVDILGDANPDGVFDDESVPEITSRRVRIAIQFCALQSLETNAAAGEFASEVGTIRALLGDITGAGVALLKQSRNLVSSPGESGTSFLADLELKLAFARDLVGECGTSRKLVDETVDQVVTAIVELESMATNVAGMAIDMTIIGTNAVVTSYRLGSRGLALSVIAQHLRTHALHVADEVGRIRPSLSEVLTSAKGLTEAGKGQDSLSMSHIASGMTEALTAFQSGDKAVADIRAQLEVEVSAVSGLLRQAIIALHDGGDVDANLEDAVLTMDDLFTQHADHSALPDPSIDTLLRHHYTMESERTIHDAFMGPAGSANARMAPAAAPAIEDVWL